MQSCPDEGALAKEIKQLKRQRRGDQDTLGESAAGFLTYQSFYGILYNMWIAIHEDELQANWKLLSNGDGYFKIEPMR